ncbi:unnamed protein product [Pedinophyceae sp. YPF-701]|nr:unnamed protein product [Pedinophyceae sp. YPF-701]
MHGTKGQAFTVAACAVESLSGFVLLCVSAASFTAYTRLSAALIGALLFGRGIAGWAGVTQRRPHLLALHTLGGVIVVVLTFSLLTQVARDVQVDCAIAELYVRGRQAESILRSTAQNELLASMTARMNELEDTLGQLHSGALAASQLKLDRHTLRLSDRDYIRRKIATLKRRAEEVVSDMVAGRSKGGGADAVRLTDAERDALYKRFKQAEAIMDRADAIHTADDSELSADEYEELLTALGGLYEEHTADLHRADAEVRGQRVAALADLKGDVSELSQAREKIEGLSGGRHAELRVGDAGAKLAAQLRKRSKRRAVWQKRFHDLMGNVREEALGGARGSRFAPAEDMPEHCVRELRARPALVWGAWVLLVVQLAANVGVLGRTLSGAVASKAD